MESRKMVPKNLFAVQQWRNWLGEQTNRHGERGGESEMYGKNYMETYITICKIDGKWEFVVCLRKLKQGLCINLEGWYGEGDGKEANYYKCTLNNFKIYQMKIRETYKWNFDRALVLSVTRKATLLVKKKKK